MKVLVKISIVRKLLTGLKTLELLKKVKSEFTFFIRPFLIKYACIKKEGRLYALLDGFVAKRFRLSFLFKIYLVLSTQHEVSLRLAADSPPPEPTCVLFL